MRRDPKTGESEGPLYGSAFEVIASGEDFKPHPRQEAFLAGTTPARRTAGQDFVQSVADEVIARKEI